MLTARAQGSQAWAGQGRWHWELRRPRHTPHCSRAGREEGNRRQALPWVFSGQTGGHHVVTRHGGQTDDQAGRARAPASLGSGQTMAPEEAGTVPATCRAASHVHGAGQRSVEARTRGAHYIFWVSRVLRTR